MSTAKAVSKNYGLKVSSGSHHLESVPCSTPVAHARGHMKTRDFASSPDDLDMYKRILDNADQPEELIPIRSVIFFLGMLDDGAIYKEFCFYYIFYLFHSLSLHFF